MPADYERPLCWLPYFVDNSSGSQVWVPEGSEARTNHAGNMLHFSYGKSSVYRTLIDEVNGQVQGGVYRLPIELTTAAMRGRFHPKSGDLYIIGFRGWQTNGGTGLQRVRFVSDEKPKHSAPEVKVKAAGGVRTLDQLLKVQELGCSRLGATATVAIMEEAKKRFGN